MKKKILGILLSIGLVLTMIPTSVFADSTYTLDLPGAKAVYYIYGTSNPDNVQWGWNNYGKTLYINGQPTSGDPYKTDSNSWVDAYIALEERAINNNQKFSGANGEFSLGKDIESNVVLLVLTDTTVLVPGVPYKVYAATVSNKVITPADSPFDTGNLSSESETKITQVDAVISIDLDNKVAELTSPDSVNYSLVDNKTSLYAMKQGLESDEIVGTFDFENKKWMLSEGGASPVGDIPNEDFDFYVWDLNLVPKKGYLFSNDLSTITINETTYSVGDEPDYDKFKNNMLSLEFFVKSIPVQKFPEVVEEETDVYGDVVVDYEYTPESNTAEKVFYVTIGFTFPTELDAQGAQNVYTWDSTNGKYTKDTANSTDASYVLNNDGAFSITLTNKSNVGIDYKISYDANGDAIFSSHAENWNGEEEGTLDTVATGQTVDEDEIDIEDVDAATEGNTDFDTATCTGTLVVDDINNEPELDGTDKLGTFTIEIYEAVEEEEKNVLVENLLDTVEAGFSGLNGSSVAPWTNGSATCFVDDNVLKFFDGESNYITATLDKSTTPDGDNYKCTTIVASTGVSPITNITFTMSEGKLVSITTAGSNSDLTALYGEYSAPVE